MRVSDISSGCDRAELTSEPAEPTTRRIAAYTVGVAVEKAPAVYAEFAAHAVESLFASIGDVDTSDNELLFARDNAVSAREPS